MQPNSDSQNILNLVKQINRNATALGEGPNCLDPSFCTAKCCYTSPDLPKTLVNHYIGENWATIDQFELSNTLEFRIKLNPGTKRCVFYDPKLNGCLIHTTDMKPPQCTLYPFNEQETKHICRNNYEFIFDTAEMNSLMRIFDEYYDLAKNEFRENNTEAKIRTKLEAQILPILKTHKPSEIEGIREDASGFHIHSSLKLSYEGVEYCNAISCEYYYEDCPKVCNSFLDRVIEDLISIIFSRKNKHQITDEYRLRSLFREN